MTIWKTVVLGLGLLAAADAVRAQDPNLCDVPGEVPDIIVGDITNPRRWGSTGGITGYSFRTDSCNVGTCEAEWYRESVQHPVIGQNLFRLENGRFEQIGQAWLKHGFSTIQEVTCSQDCLPSADNQHLGVACSDAYSSNLNGYQPGMGPKFEVNPVTGAFPWPFTDRGTSGDEVYKRLQVQNSDLEPDLHPGAQYFVEVQYIAPDDSAAGNQLNNASYRPATIYEPMPGVYDLILGDVTKRELPAIVAWQTADPSVRLEAVDADGRFYVGAKVTDLGGGTWRYEYAVHNFNSHESARSFSVPLGGPALVTNIGFHDVDYHSGEPYDGTDWPGVHDPVGYTVSWSTDTFQQNPDANALRWGTLYNYRFDVGFPPVVANATLGLFRGDLAYDHVLASTLVPFACVASSSEELVCGDGIDDDCDLATDCADFDCCDFAACQDGMDADGDSVADCDCDDGDPNIWSRPDEVHDIVASVQNGTGHTLLDWSPPATPGATQVTYSVLRSTDGASFASATCLGLQDPSQPTGRESAIPPPGGLYNYLARARNACPNSLGEGPLGSDSSGTPRSGPTCP